MTGWFLKDLRAAHGPTTVDEGTRDFGDGKDFSLQKLMVADALPPVSETMPRVTADGQPVTTLHTMLRDEKDVTPGGITVEQYQAATNMADSMNRLNQSAEDISSLKDDVNAVAQQYVEANKTNDDGTPRSTESIYSALRKNISFVTEANQALSKRLMDQDFLDNLADAMS
jgi:hypothetical protein